MRQASHRILYTVANSNAMNGISSTQEVVALTPWWQIALYALTTVCGIMTVVGVVMVIRSVKKNKKLIAIAMEYTKTLPRVR